MQHGADLLLGGHDHLYFVSKGVAAWDGYVIGSESLGTEQDDGVYVIKSGSDFRDLSDMELVLEDMPEGSVRRKVIKEIKGEWSSCHLVRYFPLTDTFEREAMGHNARFRILRTICGAAQGPSLVRLGVSVQASVQDKCTTQREI